MSVPSTLYPRLRRSLSGIGRRLEPHRHPDAVLRPDNSRDFGDALVHYKIECVRLLAQMSLGIGVLAIIGGTIVIVGFPHVVRRVPDRDSGLQPATGDR